MQGKFIFDQLLLNPQIFDHLLIGPYKDIDDFLTNLVENRFRKNPNLLLLSIFDKTKPSQLPNDTSHVSPGALAGLIGLGVGKESEPGLTTAIDLLVIILPPFQRTHVMSNAVGLTLNFLLNTPCPSQPEALGIRRVVWHASTANETSIRAAVRMGFTLESVLRWQSVLPAGKVGNRLLPREGDPRKDNLGRDTAVLSLCWEDWEGGMKDRVAEIMNRVA